MTDSTCLYTEQPKQTEADTVIIDWDSYIEPVNHKQKVKSMQLSQFLVY